MCDIKRGMAKHLKIGRRLSFMGYGACALAGCLWGTGFYWGRLALNEMSVEHMVLYRFIFASVGMLPVVLVNRSRVRLTGPVSRPGADHRQPRLALRISSRDQVDTPPSRQPVWSNSSCAGRGSYLKYAARVAAAIAPMCLGLTKPHTSCPGGRPLTRSRR
jgi:hypothetical protein